MPFTIADFEDEKTRKEVLSKQQERLDELGRLIQEHRAEQGARLEARELSPYEAFRTSSVGRKLFGPTADEREGQIGGGNVGVLEIPQAMLKFTTAPPQITEPMRQVTEPAIEALPEGAARGIARGARELGIGLAGSLPAGAVLSPRAIMAPFAADYLSTIPEQTRAIEEAAIAQNPEALAERLVQTVGGAVATGLGTVAGARARPVRDRPVLEPQDRPITLEPTERLASTKPEALTSERATRQPDELQAGAQAKPKGRTTLDQLEQDASASAAWLEAIARNDQKTIRNAEAALLGEPPASAAGGQALLEGSNVGRVSVRTPSNIPRVTEAPVETIGTRPSQERGRPGQQAGEPGIVERVRTHTEPSLFAAESLGKEIHQLHELPIGQEKTLRIRSLLDLLSKADASTKIQIVNTIKSYARQNRPSATLYGPVRPQPIEGAREVPTEISRERVQPQAEQGIQEEAAPAVPGRKVLLTPEAPPAVLPEAIALAKQYADKPAELEALHADAVKASADAQAAYGATTGPAKMEAFEKWQALSMRPQPYAEALQLLGQEKAPTPVAPTATPQAKTEPLKFAGYQYGVPKWFYQKPGAPRATQLKLEDVQAKKLEYEPAPPEAEWQASQAATQEAGKARAAELFPGQLEKSAATIPPEATPKVQKEANVPLATEPIKPQSRADFDKQNAGMPPALRDRLWAKQQKAPKLGTQLAAGIPDPVATVKAAADLIGEGVTMARRVEAINQAIGKPKEVAPPIKTEVDTPLPDFQEHATSKKIFSQPFGFERIPILGAAFGGTRRLLGHVNETLSAYWAERQIGRSVASAFGNEYSWLRKPFEIKDGQITNIEAAPGKSRYISDVFEGLQRDPAAYRLTPEQQAAFEAIQALEKDFSRLEKKYKIGNRFDNEGSAADLADAPTESGPYFPRIVTSRPGGTTSGLTRGASVGSKAFFEKPRLFETEAEGWARGFRYEPDIVNRLTTRVERLYKRIADKRLAEDPALEGKTRKDVEAQLKESFAEELASGEMTEKKISQIADSIQSRGTVYAPAFFNKIFPEATANQLNKAFPKSQSALRRAAVSVNDALKGLQLGMDLGVGFIQGQALLSRHPFIWGKAQVNSITAMFRPEQFPNYVRQNIEAVRELAQLGSGVGRLEEYMAGIGKGGLLSKVPVVKQVIKPFERQFQTYLDVAKIEMWKGLRETTPREQWSDVVQSLESIISSGRMEGVGVSAGRNLLERILLLAPAYYRGGLNHIAGVAEKGVAGQVLRRSLTAYATAGAVLYYGLGKSAGMSDEELKRRMNPMRTDFMDIKVKSRGRTLNVGFGGFYRSLLRLMGNIAKTSMEHPENWASLSPKKNPIIQWYRGHAGPVVSQAWDQFSGKDYLGHDVDVSSTVRSITPLAIQAMKGKVGQPSPVAEEVAGQFIGSRVRQITPKQELATIHRDWLSRNPDPKVQADLKRKGDMSLATSKYAPLDTALADNDLDATKKAIADLVESGEKRKTIYQRMKPFNEDGSRRPLFHESRELEARFVRSLTPEQKQLYEEALRDRIERFRLFRKALERN